jgi:monofunctional biosynthetic peptidoglycan transglycosylase
MLRWTARIVVIFIAGSVIWVMAYRFINPPTTFTMIGNWIDGKTIYRDWLPISKIDRDMPRAAIAAEDSNFCSHWGFDLQAIGKAFERNQKGRKLRGGSTISQQTAKNAFLWQGRSWLRKGLEAWFTVLIELLWSKERIMEVYLNIAETGIGTFGVNSGAKRYFHHDATRLSPSEAARIAAVLPLPKKREAVSPGGFTRRYGNNIQRRIAVVARDGLDSCLR